MLTSGLLDSQLLLKFITYPLLKLLSTASRACLLPTG